MGVQELRRVLSASNRYFKFPPTPGLLIALLAVAIISIRVANAGQSIAVIANHIEKPTIINRITLENIYRRKILIDDLGQAYIPVNLPVTHPLRLAFSSALYHQSPEELEPYWSEQYFHGISPPFVLASVEAVLRFVSTTPGAIGYVLECQVDARVEIVTKLQVPDSARDLDSLCPE